MHIALITPVAFVTLCIGTGTVADPVAFTGVIGPYEIEAQLDAAADGAITGRYRYAGREAWLALAGETFDRDAISLTESVNGAETGQFFLEVASNGLTGFWVAGTTDHPVTLIGAPGAIDALFPPVMAEPVSPTLTGRYHTGLYWVNDWFAPNYEIGFSGGDVNVARIDDETLLIDFTFVVGPTYHLAVFRGAAQQTDERVFVYDEAARYSDGRCTLTFDFSGGGLSIADQSSSSDCGFGARAHANFDLEKVSDRAEFTDQW